MMSCFKKQQKHSFLFSIRSMHIHRDRVSEKLIEENNCQIITAHTTGIGNHDLFLSSDLFLDNDGKETRHFSSTTVQFSFS